MLTAAALGAVAGLRSMAAPALLTFELSEHSGPHDRSTVEKLLTSQGISRVLAMFAGGEMVADKSEEIPNRTDPLPLITRALIGSLSAAAFAAHKRHAVALPAAIGAASAIASTYASFHLRRIAGERLNVPDRVLGLVEDAFVLAASKGIGMAMEEQL
jgi:uncharacterized membrane protein